MSAPATRLELEETESHRMNESPDAATDVLVNADHDEETIARLGSLASGPIIAVDMDDVLSATNRVVAQWHNEKFGSKMDVSNFYYYYYWKNPFWGNPALTFEKVRSFYGTQPGVINSATPIPGAREGTQALRDLGYRLIVVTARTKDVADESWDWINKYFPGIFESIICTGQFKDPIKTKFTNDTAHEIVTKLTKAEVCADLPAVLLIDDSLENALSCAQATRTLIFGDNQWNQRVCIPTDHSDDMAWDRRIEITGSTDFLAKDAELAQAQIANVNQGQLHRVKDWGEVIRWVKAERGAGRL